MVLVCMFFGDLCVVFLLKWKWYIEMYVEKFFVIVLV